MIRLLFLAILCPFFVSCRSPQTIVHYRAGQLSPPRKFAIFMDGTGNDANARTNIRRLFEVVSSQHRPDILTYYADGVGTDWRKISGGAFGWGFSRNVREAVTFVASRYKPGDEIYVFGFSRGAYQAMDLCGFLQTAGIPLNRGSKTKDEIKLLYSEYRKAVKSYSKEKWDSAGGAALKPKERMQGLEDRLPKTIFPEIRVLGIWDAVEALGVFDFARTSFGHSQRAETKRQRGHKSHWINLGPEIERCYYALSLDEQRQPFMAELPDWKEGQPRHYEFVWFAGDHSDVGGGHDKYKDLSGISFNWMLERVAGNLLPTGSAKPNKVHQNAAGPRHDVATQSAMMSLVQKRVRGEMFSDDRVNQQIKNNKGIEARPVRSQGWTMMIHKSVIERMESKGDAFGGERTTRSLEYEKSQGFEKKYVPRPFRGTNGWVTHDLKPQEISQQFILVE
ncbi:MAG: DUF2235 domain-containing protein [Verrucomicrobia bacterium]|nr:DUF2235 domain-containing protein [Verrucomicrobiota bacterium]